MSLQELRNLTITQVQWYGNIVSLGFTLSDGKNCRAGTSYDFNRSHVFDPSKKITKIVTTVNKYEDYITQINFFSGEELLCKVGLNDGYDWMKGGRDVAFEIADDQQLIGCQLDESTVGGDFCGVTWMKMKVKF